jgi:hypothetical protein
MVNSRQKGYRGEKEALELLEEHLGLKLVRNRQQDARGGRDLIEDVDRHQHPMPFAFEVKRAERVDLAGWWRQTVAQARAVQRKPVLMFRVSRQPWTLVLDAHDVNPQVWPVRRDQPLVMAWDVAFQWMREVLK